MELMDDTDDQEFRDALDAKAKVTNAFMLPSVTGRVERLAMEAKRHVQCIHSAFRGIEPPDPRSPKINCHAYSLKLYTAEEFQDLLIEPEPPFIDFLVESKLLVMKSIDGANDGEIVVYGPSGNRVHSGVVSGSFVESKWGEGSVYEHTLFAVPAAYGSQVQVSARPSLEDVVAAYVEFYEDQ